MNKSLLENVKLAGIKSRRIALDYTDEEIELAVAWINKQITSKEFVKGLSVGGRIVLSTGYVSGYALPMLKQGIRKGIISIKFSKP